MFYRCKICKYHLVNKQLVTFASCSKRNMLKVSFFACFGHITRNGVGCECGIKVSHPHKKSTLLGSNVFEVVVECGADFHVDQK